jgi:hypothetical protein
MFNQIIFGLLIPFCVQWVHYLPGVKGVCCLSLFSSYILSVFSHLTFRLFCCTEICLSVLTCLLTISNVQCFRHTRLPQGAEIQGLLDDQRVLWKPRFPTVTQTHLPNWHLHQCHHLLEFERALWLAWTTRRWTRDSEHLFLNCVLFLITLYTNPQYQHGIYLTLPNTEGFLLSFLFSTHRVNWASCNIN